MNNVYPFFSYKSPLSNYHAAKFSIDNIEYHHVEQYMMAKKALLFNDHDACEEIMSYFKPLDCKRAGRKIKNFDPSIWEKNKRTIVKNACLAKFKQNAHCLKELKATGRKLLAEASPYDKIWGIGLEKNHQDVQTPSKWKGTNLLGTILMEVREELNVL